MKEKIFVSLKKLFIEIKLHYAFYKFSIKNI